MKSAERKEQSANGSNEFQSTGCEGGHSQKQQAVPEAADVGRTVGAFAVADGEVEDFEIHLGRAEEKIEIAEGVEVAEIGSIGGQLFVITLTQDLRAAKSVLHTLPEQAREGPAEEFVPGQVEQSHRVLFHWVDQAHTVDEF